MSVFLDGSGEDVRGAYEGIRNEAEPNSWAMFGYEGKKIKLCGIGENYNEMVPLLTDDERFYCYARFQKENGNYGFAFITWIGPSVSPLMKAKVSTDKAFVKAICTNFGKEVLADERSEVAYQKVLQTLEAASGAAYGTGK